MGVGVTELIIILLLALIIFGPAKLPEIGKALGKGIGEFKRAAKSIGESDDDGDDHSSSDEKGGTQ